MRDPDCRHAEQVCKKPRSAGNHQDWAGLPGPCRSYSGSKRTPIRPTGYPGPAASRAYRVSATSWPEPLETHAHPDGDASSAETFPGPHRRCETNLAMRRRPRRYRINRVVRVSGFESQHLKRIPGEHFFCRRQPGLTPVRVNFRRAFTAIDNQVMDGVTY